MIEDIYNEPKGKVIIVDWGIFSHQAIFVYAKLMKDKKTNPNVFVTQSNKICLVSMISALSKIGVSKDDLIIIAQDNLLGSWRKQYKEEYKADRKELRDKTAEESGIVWKDEWKKMDDLISMLKEKAPVHVVNIPNIEADDIAAVACKYYADKQIICVSYDGDWEQFWHYGDRVKLFSIKKKNNPYKIRPSNFNVYKKIAKEITSKTHNNLGSEVASERDYEIKKLIIDMINLPKEVTEPIIEVLKDLSPNHGGDYSSIVTSVNCWNNVYDNKRVITYEKCLKASIKDKKYKGKKK